MVAKRKKAKSKTKRISFKLGTSKRKVKIAHSPSLKSILKVLAVACVLGAVGIGVFAVVSYVIRDGLRLDIDVALWLADQHWLVVVLSWFTLLWEGSFFLVLVFPALALVYVPLGVALHMGIHVMMRATFFGFLACYSVFVPWRAIIQRLRQRVG